MHITLSCNGEHINTQCSVLGRCTDRLSEKGVLESLRLANALKDQHFDFIFCSDFGYRRTTTDLVIETLKHKQFHLIVDSKLREKDAEICSHFGKEQLQKADFVAPEHSEILSRLFIKTESNSTDHQRNESMVDTQKRAHAFLHELLHQYPSNANILIIGNPLINGFLISEMLGDQNPFTHITSPCSLSSYQLKNHKRTEESFNQRQHLYGHAPQ